MEQETQPVKAADVLAIINQLQPNSGATEIGVQRFIDNPANIAGKSAKEIAQSYLSSVINVTI